MKIYKTSQNEPNDSTSEIIYKVEHAFGILFLLEPEFDILHRTLYQHRQRDQAFQIQTHHGQRMPRGHKLPVFHLTHYNFRSKDHHAPMKVLAKRVELVRYEI